MSDLPLNIRHRNGVYNFSNFDGRYLGPIIYRKALANSRNTPAVQVLQKTGLRKVYRFLEMLGLTGGERDADHYGMGMTIGGLYVSLEDLGEAYGVLANGGREFRLKWFDDGSSSAPRQLLSEDIARLVTLFLSDAQARLPSFPRKGVLEYPYPVAIKTGTSQGFRDAWTIAFSSKYIVGAWIGHPDNFRMKHVSGASVGALVQKIMAHLHPNAKRGIKESPFPRPDGYKLVRLCALNGSTDIKDCPEVMNEFLRKNRRKRKNDLPLQQKFAVDVRTGMVADRNTPNDAIRIESALMIPGIYDEWKFNRGLQPLPFARGHPLNARVEITEPLDRSTFIVDLEIPASMQTLPLRAVVTPRIPKIDWIVDGKLLRSVSYPYLFRWPLTTGKHTFQARFPNAKIASEIVTVHVSH